VIFAREAMVFMLRKKLEESTEATPVPHSDEPLRDVAGPNSLDRFYYAILKPSVSTSEGKNELDQYLQEPVCDRKTTNPLDWWAGNCKRYPILAKLAKKYLGAPPTSVPSERVFSTAGLIYDDRRFSLQGDNAEKLCFLNYNFKLLNFDY